MSVSFWGPLFRDSEKYHGGSGSWGDHGVHGATPCLTTVGTCDLWDEMVT